ncbi:DUF2062 domain-containing protein [Consotaella aegiceratis]|uniref:DUF2062 domain-containing protein n=1 Tax=Consotaella aegiceratis TaxID=3097961 RepID=UPI002F3F5909
MLFRRRQPEDFWSRVKVLLWPRHSWSRSFSYFKKRVLRLNATPHAVAAGIGAGVFASFTPFIGFHFVIAFSLAFLVAGNFAAAALGTVVGNPVTFPAIWASTYELGHFILATKHHGDPPHHLGRVLERLDFSALWDPLLKPMTVGAIPLGLLAALSAYGVVYWAVKRFRRHRARRILARQRANGRTRLVALRSPMDTTS